MTTVKKGGLEYTIADDLVDSYLAQGFEVIDGRGNVLKRGTTPAYDKLLIENAELKAAKSRLESSITAQNDKIRELNKSLNNAAELADKLTVELNALREENERLKAKSQKKKSGAE